LETLEAGIVLTGLEIKAIRVHKISLTGSYARVINNELVWVGGHIETSQGEDSQRTRKLLVNRRELKRLVGQLQQSLTLIPLKLYLKRGYAKLELGLARRKKLWDKRETIKQRELKRRSDY
jgi:SsrA-binding protein